MKAEAKRQYIDAMVEHARRMTLGRHFPVVVHAYRFLTQACERYSENPGLFHSFDPGDTKRIIDKFDSAFRDACYSGDGDGFPIYAMTVGRDVLSLCGHGKQAVIDADRTPQAYAAACTISGRNGKECWALFGPQADRKHPMIAPTFATEQKRLVTSVSNFRDKTAWVDDDSVKIDGAVGYIAS